VPVRPVYGPEWRSGIRPIRVIGPLSFLLLRAFLQRIGRGLAGLRPVPQAISDDRADHDLVSADS
jgi:hypothetical protein